MAVLLWDKSLFPRDKLCAGWITPQVVAELQIPVAEYRRKRVWQPIHGFRCGLIRGPEVEISYSRPISYGIRRCEFDAYLLRRSGAQTQLGEPVKAVERRAGQWIVNKRFRAPVLVGAGGNFCPVAQVLGARHNPVASTVAAQEVEFAVTDNALRAGSVQPEVPELFFCPDLQGYGWCFRKGNYLNIGLGRLDSSRLSQHVTQFCDFLRQRRKICCDVPRRFRGHAYQLYERQLPKLLDDGVLLVGDAAGLAYPQSGEGIRPAVESGLIAADVILAAAGSYHREDLAPYRDQILGRLGKPRSPGLLACLPASWLRGLATRLLATKWFVRHVVMDNWFLHQQQAPL